MRLPRECLTLIFRDFVAVLRFGSHRQPLQTRVSARNAWRVDLRLDPSFCWRCNGGLAAQIGQRRPPARSLRLGERTAGLDLR